MPKGGSRIGSGRKPKVQEVKLIEQMDAISVPQEIWEALLFKCKQGDTSALKLWLAYRFGMPKQQVDITTNGESIAPPIQWITNGLEFNQAEAIDFEAVAIHGEALAIHGLDTLSDE
jgi:hypothetical protein